MSAGDGLACITGMYHILTVLFFIKTYSILFVFTKYKASTLYDFKDFKSRIFT